MKPETKPRILLNTFGLNKFKIRDLMIETALKKGQSKKDFLTKFEASFRASINKPSGQFASKEIPEYIKAFEEWINAIE